jgi:hypothetical protein
MRHQWSVAQLIVIGVASLCLNFSPVSAVGRATPLAGRSDSEAMPLPVLLTRAASYLDGYEKKLSAAIAEEDYTFSGSYQRESLRSDIMLLGLGKASWVEFRDVFEFNGLAIRKHIARLQALLGSSSGVLLISQAQAIADESARYNVGVQRNINVPTMALSYLSSPNQWRSVFQITGEAAIVKARATVVAFRETAEPSLIHASLGTLEASGRFWIVPATGAVLKTELSVKIPEGGNVGKADSVGGTITVDYLEDATLKLLVPHEMDESYDLPSRIMGHATYSQYKAFAVTVTTSGAGGGS